MAIVNGLPDSGLITLNVKPEFWAVCRNVKTGNLLIQGLIDCDDKKKSIIISCSKIFGPDGLLINTQSNSTDLIPNMLGEGMSKIVKSLVDYQMKYQWVILGRIEGYTPIIVTCYQNLNICFYTFDLSIKEKAMFKDFRLN